jgi:hypothetical protein
MSVDNIELVHADFDGVNCTALSDKHLPEDTKYGSRLANCSFGFLQRYFCEFSSRLWLPTGFKPGSGEITDAFIFPWLLGDNRFVVKKWYTGNVFDMQYIRQRYGITTDIANVDLEIRFGWPNSRYFGIRNIQEVLIKPPFNTRQAPPVWAKVGGALLGVPLQPLGTPERAVRFNIEFW